MALTTVQSGMMDSVAQYYTFKNRIINGAMVIDQRNAGASITPTNGQFSVDRWVTYNTQASKYTSQQNAGSVTPPAGFTNYLGVTSSSAYSVLTSDYFGIVQIIEGYNIADLAWGTASASTVTFSFWVRSSLTGTFGGALRNYAGTRAYPFSYTISSANTWEQKIITVVGETTGSWPTNNTAGLVVWLSLGAGATYSGTAGAWTSSNIVQPSGSTSVVGTNGATFYVTGVQLEKGVTATSFDYRPYTTELQLCQRYFEKSYQQSVVPGTAGQNLGGVQFPIITAIPNGYQTGQSVSFMVQKRTAPTIVIYSYNGALNKLTLAGGADQGTNSCQPNLVGDWSFTTINNSGSSIGVTAGALYQFTASAEL